MKIGTRSFDGPQIDYLVIPRPDGDVPFAARAVLDRGDFDKLCPEPVPPNVMRPGDPPVMSVNTEDPDYKAKIIQRNKTWVHWLILKSLEATEGISWDTVDMSDPATWGNYVEELRLGGFNLAEIDRIRVFAMGMNAITSEKLDEAKKRFLASKLPQSIAQ